MTDSRQKRKEDERITERLFGGPPAGSAISGVPLGSSAPEVQPEAPAVGFDPNRYQAFSVEPETEQQLLESALQGASEEDPAFSRDESREAATLFVPRTRNADSPPSAREVLARFVVLPKLSQSARIALWALGGFVLVAFSGLWVGNLLEEDFSGDDPDISRARPASPQRAEAPAEEPSAQVPVAPVASAPVVGKEGAPPAPEVSRPAPEKRDARPLPRATSKARKLPASGLVPPREPARAETSSSDVAEPSPRSQPPTQPRDFTRPMAPLLD